MADFPSFATLPQTGAIQPTFVPSDVSTIDRINFYLELSGFNTEQRRFYQKLQQTFSLFEVPAGTWTLTAIASSGDNPAASASQGASATVEVGAGETTTVTLGAAASGFTKPANSTLLNRGNSYAWLEDAVTYVATRFGASAYDAIPDVTREQLLITATSQIDRSFQFIGTKLDSGQLLEFPRFFRRGALNVADEMRFIPREVMEATIEQALFLFDSGAPTSERAQLQAEGVASIGYGRAQESYREGGARSNIGYLAQAKLSPWIARTFRFNAFSPYVEHS